MTSSSRIASNLLGLVGATLGAILGYYTFLWIYHRGFYGMMIPGAMLGLGCGFLARHPSTPRGVACAVAALGLGVFIEWWLFPFENHPSLGYFLSKISHLNTVTLLMIPGGAFFAYLFGKDCATGYFGSIGAGKPGRPNMTASHSD
ncbi:MAG: hypothetical protein P4L85_05765 [Paludisphaera borealis]|uniref:hypothetical protein n=1 Tax=Paludisphaera borealis TaxID=1387353 RepID=UPI002844071B|nr:hypothetical protein [Paludisphaera borealis]MDR3618839.1 hypothetical protein [Paludisphaera borealis]